MGASVFFEGSNELATLTNTFTVDGAATDPTAVTLAVTSPTGTTTTYDYDEAEITRSSAGVFTKDIACTEDGVWKYVWTGTGTASDVVAGTWTVHGTELQRLYCTPEELKSRTGISDTYDDLEILAACTAVSRWIDEHCRDQFWRGTATRTFQALGPYHLALEASPLVSITTLKTDAAGDGTFETTWSASDYQLLPPNATTHAEARPYRYIKALANTFPSGCSTGARDDRVQVEGVFGWPAVPVPVKQAAAIMSNDYLKLGGMAFGVQGYAEYGVVRARNSGPAMDLLSPYRRMPVLVA